MTGEDGDTICVSPIGDLRLIVDSKQSRKRAWGKDQVKPATKTFIVSSVVLCHASAVWKTMLGPEGHFKEADTSVGTREVHFAEDDGDALLLLLRIAHLEFAELPATLTYEQLLDVAILCDKYDVLRLVRPWSAKWEDSWKPSACDSGHEESLFIAWTFGDVETYTKVTRLLVTESTSNDAGQCLRDGKLLEKDMPPGAIDSILGARSVTITALLTMCDELVALYQSDNVVCKAGVHHNTRRKCDALVLGSLIKGLQSLKIWPVPVSPNDVHKSVKDVTKELRSLDCFALDDNHGYCLFTQRLDEQIRSIEEGSMPCGIDDYHLKHIEDQAAK